jgi:hypothetical protein
VNLQAPSVEVDEPQLPEPVHKQADPCAGCAHHLANVSWLIFGDYGLGFSIFAKMLEQKKNPGQPLVTGIEKLVTRSAWCRMFLVNRYATDISDKACSRWSAPIIALFSTGSSAQSVIRSCGSHARWLTCQATFSK